jgi:hypothetical protein
MPNARLKDFEALMQTLNHEKEVIEHISGKQTSYTKTTAARTFIFPSPRSSVRRSHLDPDFQTARYAAMPCTAEHC